MATRKRKNKQNDIIIMPRKINLNIGLIIFGIIFVYLIILVVLYAKEKHIIGYEVTTGSLTVSNVYEGIAIRQETSVSSNNSGYVNYFAREGSHVACGDLVYTVDQSGSIADMISSGDEHVMLSDDDLSQIRADIITFDHSFSEKNFSKAYDFKYALQGMALKMSNYNMLSNLDAINGVAGSVQFYNAPQSGTVVYYQDGYETATAETLAPEQFDRSKYEKTLLAGNELIGDKDCVYKLITSEDWEIVIPIPKERVAEFEEKEYVEVKFLKNQFQTWASIHVIQKGEDAYARLSFNNYMSSFATDRFIDLEILENAETGLKIPNSAIVNSEFFLIPKEYLTKGSNSSKNGFLLETYKEDGTVSTAFKELTIYSEDESDYYVDTASLRVGDYICMPDSDEKYAVSKTGSLTGVYNINKGYADFTEITVLSSNDEYSIVKSNTRYGLAEYDHIVLDATSVKANDLVR